MCYENTDDKYPIYQEKYKDISRIINSSIYQFTGTDQGTSWPHGYCQELSVLCK